MISCATISGDELRITLNPGARYLLNKPVTFSIGDHKYFIQLLPEAKSHAIIGPNFVALFIGSYVRLLNLTMLDKYETADPVTGLLFDCASPGHNRSDGVPLGHNRSDGVPPGHNKIDILKIYEAFRSYELYVLNEVPRFPQLFENNFSHDDRRKITWFRLSPDLHFIIAHLRQIEIRLRNSSGNYSKKIIVEYTDNEYSILTDSRLTIGVYHLYCSDRTGEIYSGTYGDFIIETKCVNIPALFRSLYKFHLDTGRANLYS